ncbi:MAG: 1-deoxy-D-xylulose-5-phosphate reductoisomerase, partial [Planctomycetes bacterium]|nr:1-deoxy-D-xylulose-5-phosphate reductoisomerase [Planctomycetota bacterium]
SIIHSMVEFCDGSVVAQMGLPDMKVPIRFALTYPDRAETAVPPLDLVKLGSLTFQTPDFGKFPALRLGYEAARTGGTLGAVLNGANEVAVKGFLDGHIKFTDIIPLVEQALRRHSVVPSPSLDDIIRADEWARSEVHRCLSTN